MSMLGAVRAAVSHLTSLESPSGGESQGPKYMEYSISNDASRHQMPLLNQGQTNGCGTTSLAMIMTFLGQMRTQADIDTEIRRRDIFSAPNDLVEYARDAGLNAEMYNHGTAEELAHFVDQGIPTQILTTADGSGDASKMHYVVITGYEVEKDGSLSFEVYNPWGVKQTWSAEQLEERWGSVPYGFDHFYLAVAPADVELPPSRTEGVEGTLNAADGIGSVVAGYDRVVRARTPGEFLRGIGDVTIGVPQAIVGGVVGGLQLGADYLEREVRDMPVIGAPLAAGLEHLEDRLGTVGIVAGAIGNSFGHLHSSVEHFANGEILEGANDLLQSQLDLVEGAWDASVDVVEDTVESVEDIGVAVADAATDVAQGVSNTVGGAVDSIGAWTGWW